jgi:hypothetical protein
MINDSELVKWQQLYFKVQEKELIETYKLFVENAIEPILIKGWAVSQFYPVPSTRMFSDLDLCVSPEQYQKAGELIQQRTVSIPVDVHQGVKHLDTVSFDDLLKNSTFLELDGVLIRVLRPEDHLRVLAVHWLLDGGGNLERLWDIHHLINKTREGFDWERCLGVIDKKRRRWIICVIWATHHYVGLSIKDLTVFPQIKNVPEWFKRAVQKEADEGQKLFPLQTCLKDPKLLWKQIRKRFPPNPIQATVELNGDFDKFPRMYYQVMNMGYRINPSFWRIVKRVLG